MISEHCFTIFFLLCFRWNKQRPFKKSCRFLLFSRSLFSIIVFLYQSLFQFAHTLRLPFFSPLSAFLHTKLFAKIPLRLTLHIHVMSISGKCTDCIPDTEYKTKK